MSVINQMLKDLDKRQQDQVQASTTNVPIVSHQSKSQRWVIILLLMLLMISLGVIVWQKFGVNSNDMLLVTQSNDLQNQSISQVKSEALISNNLALESEQQALISSATDETLKDSANNMVVSVPEEPINTHNKVVNLMNTEQVNAHSQSSQEQANEVSVKELSAKEDAISDTFVNAIPPSEVLPITTVPQAITTESETNLPQAAEATLTISRKQLTPDQLASKKIIQAEQAIADKDLKKAEQLFEDVLLVVPSHKSARKQLAALWFGKQSYQAALNLLSQGLALDNQDSEFRLMKARIYLNQGLTQAAFDVLMVLDNLRVVEYQSLLASTAQQLSLFSSSAKAYSILTELAPNVGRWWLGLAIAQDSHSQFSEAKNSYQNALKQQDLSSETAQFAKNRILELGE